MWILNCSLPHDSADRHSVAGESPPPRKKSREELIGEPQTLILASLKCHGYLVSLCLTFDPIHDLSQPSLALFSSYRSS